MTVPLVLVVGLLLGGAGSKSPASPSSSAGAALPVVTVSAPPSSDSATISTCAQVISAMPLTLDGLDLARTVSTPSSPSIVAWGNPAIVMRCGVARPKALKAGASSFVVAVNGVNLLPSKGANNTSYVVIDRSVYLDLTVPSSYAQPPLGPIATAVAKTLPQICAVPDANGNTTVPNDKLCTRRK